MKFTLETIDNGFKLQLPSGASFRLLKQNHPRIEKLGPEDFFILIKQNQVLGFGRTEEDLKKAGQLEFDRLVLISVPQAEKFGNIERVDLLSYLVELTEEAGLTLKLKTESKKLPKNIYKACAKASEEILQAFSIFDIKLEKKKSSPVKVQHRFKKSLSEIPFNIRHEGTSGIVIWEKTNVMRLLKGAKILPETELPLRKDGTFGFTAKFAKTLRDEHRSAIDENTWTTTEDILLRSVNEVGHFVYFAGTNSWLELFDDEGQSLHELSVV